MSEADDYATEVMRILSDGTIRVGVWSERERDLILRTIREHFLNPGHLELIVDNPSSANFRLKQDREVRNRVRVADYRLSSVGKGERADVAEVNDKLRAIPAAVGPRVSSRLTSRFPRRGERS